MIAWMCAVAAIEQVSLHAFNRTVRLTSFGFRHGIPEGKKADILIDARYLTFHRLKYPFLNREHYHGLQPLDILGTIHRKMDNTDFLDSEIRVNIGCEEGLVKSVEMVRWLAERCWRNEWHVQTHHRDLFRNGKHT